MWKRLLSTLLVLCMAPTLLPAARAAGDSFPGPGPEPEPEAWPLSWDPYGEAEDAAPSFMPGTVPETYEPSYPDYDFPAGEPGLEPIELEEEPENGIPEFVPGLIPEEYELDYPSYDFPALMADSYYDTRELYQSPTKSQGANGLCWAFGTYATLEAHARKQGFGILDFSELHMAYSTSSSSGNTRQGWDRIPSAGGHRFQSTAYLMRGTALSGTVDDAADPYDRKLIGERPLSISESKEQTYTVQNVMFFTGGEKATDAEVFLIKWALKEYGGVGASIYIKGQTTAEDGDEDDVRIFFNQETASYYYNRAVDPEGSSGANHAVEIAGWDDDYPIENFNETCRPSKPGAWLIKNSWGANWGDNGYAWVSYEDTNFPLNTYCFNGIKPYDSSTIVHETDYKTSGGTGWGSATQGFFAKAYTTETDSEQLQSVRVYVTAPCSTIEVDCIPDFSGDTSWNGYTFSPKGTMVLEPSYPGWYTIDLDTPVALGRAGSPFAVIVRLAGEQGIKISYDGVTTSNAPAYYSSGGRTWGEATEKVGYSNYCIKAVTKPAAQADQDKVTVGKAASALGALGWELIKGENAARDQVRRDLALPVSFNYGTTVTWRSSNPSIVGTDGTVTRPVGDTPASVTLTAAVCKGSAVIEIPIDVVVSNVPAGAARVLESITWDAIRGDNANPAAVTSALDLIASNEPGVAVTWQSSDTDIIGTDGTVTPPRFDIRNTVELTVTASQNGEWQDKVFTVIVPHRAETPQDVADAVGAWFGKDWYNNWWSEIRGDNASFSNIRTDLTLPRTITLLTGNGGAYTVEIEDEAMPRSAGAAWAYVSETGAVTRPAFGEEDSKGVFYLRLKYNNETKLVGGYIITVLAYKGTLKIDAQPEDAAVDSGSTAVLTVGAGQDQGVAGEIGKITYQWYRAADAVGSGAQPIDGATGRTYRTPANLADGNYYYYCEVSAPDAPPVKTKTARVRVGDVTAYAIIFDPDGGSLTGGMATETDDTGRLSSLPIPTRDGFTFAGWYWYAAAEDGTMSEAKATVNTVFTADAVLSARWTAASGVFSGYCGAGATWTYDNGCLTIQGAGPMADYNTPDSGKEVPPWYEYHEVIDTVVICDGVTSIGAYAFFDCGNLRSVSIPNSVAGIGSGAFWWCSSLESAAIPSGVAGIGFAVFRECGRLRNVSIPDSVTSIGYSAFYHCGSLESVDIPERVNTIREWAFAGCGSLRGVTIPAGVTAIGDYTFYNCSGLESVSIPASVTGIGARAFCNCGSLKSVSIPDNVASIGNSAFSGCGSLRGAAIPAGVTAIGDYTFYRCASLESVSIPSSVTGIGYAAFWGCGALADVYYDGDEDQWTHISIGDYNSALLNAPAHYNAGPDGEILRVSLGARLTGDGRVHYTVYSDASRTVFVVAAMYEGNGKLREKQLAPLAVQRGETSGTLDFLAAPAGSDYVRVFLLDAAEHTPLCAARDRSVPAAG